MERRGEHMERLGEHMERRGEHMERHVGIARGRPHVARGWREWRQSSRDGGALLPRRRRLRTSRGRIRAALLSCTICPSAVPFPIPVTNDRAHDAILRVGLLKPPHRVTTSLVRSACTARIL
jgi:hypothetical protein